MCTKVLSDFKIFLENAFSFTLNQKNCASKQLCIFWQVLWGHHLLGISSWQWQPHVWNHRAWNEQHSKFYLRFWQTCVQVWWEYHIFDMHIQRILPDIHRPFDNTVDCTSSCSQMNKLGFCLICLFQFINVMQVRVKMVEPALRNSGHISVSVQMDIVGNIVRLVWTQNHKWEFAKGSLFAPSAPLVYFYSCLPKCDHQLACSMPLGSSWSSLLQWIWRNKWPGSERRSSPHHKWKGGVCLVWQKFWMTNGHLDETFLTCEMSLLTIKMFSACLLQSGKSLEVFKNQTQRAIIWTFFYPCLQARHSCASDGGTIAIWFNFFEGGCHAGSTPFRMFGHEVKVSCSCYNDNELRQV